MVDWQEFEEKAFRYLRRRYSDEGHIHFIKEGGPNSLKLDLKVQGRNGKEMYLEVKCPKAQAGQFVLDIKENNFYFKPNQKNSMPTKKQRDLIKHINLNFSKRDIFQSSIEINYECQKTSDLVKEHYLAKKTSYFITGSFDNGVNVGIIPLDNLSEAFIFKITLRRKRSGTRSLPIKDDHIVEEIIKSKFEYLGIKIFCVKREGNKLLIKTNCKNKQKEKNLHFIGPNAQYFLSQSKQNSCEFELKVKSKTNSINIIYTSTYRGIMKKEWEKKFVEDLKKL